MDIIEQSLTNRNITKEEACAVIEQIMNSQLPIERGEIDYAIEALHEVYGDDVETNLEVYMSVSSPSMSSVRNN